jgi:hypothetical protein
MVMPLSLERDAILPLKCNVLQEDFNAYKKAITKTIERNIELLKELPPPKNFAIEDIIAYFQKAIRNDLENDKLFEKSVEVSKYAQSMFESIHKYFAKIYSVNKEEKEKNSYNIFSISRLFLNSNLPGDFFKTISDSYLVENDFLDLFDRVIKKEYFKLVSYKNNRAKFEKSCNTHNMWIKKFIEKANLIEKNRAKLIWYVEINNSNKLEELFNDKFIKEENLDQDILTKLINDVAEITTQLEHLVLTDLKPYRLPKFDDSMQTIVDLMTTITQ